MKFVVVTNSRVINIKADVGGVLVKGYVKGVVVKKFVPSGGENSFNDSLCRAEAKWNIIIKIFWC